MANENKPAISEERLAELNKEIKKAQILLEKLKEQSKSLEASNANVNADYMRKKDELQSDYEICKKSLDADIDARKKTLVEISAKQTALIKDISNVLGDLKNSSIKTGEGFSGIYKNAVDAARLQLDAAMKEAEKVVGDLITFGEELHKKSEAQAKAVVEKRTEAYREIAQWRESELARIDAGIKASEEANKKEAENLAALRADIEGREADLEAQKAAIDSTVKREVALKAGAEIEKLVEVERALVERDKEIAGMQRQLDEANKTIHTQGALDKSELMRQNNALQDELQKLKRQTQPDYLKADILAKAKHYDSLQEEIQSSQEEIVKLKADNAKLSQLPGLNAVITELMKSGGEKIDELKEQLTKLKGDDYSAEFRRKPIEKPVFVRNYSDNGQTNELDWLSNIEAGVKDEGFDFSKRLLYAFHTCIKTAIWSPLTVLAGVSGTGKSELPRLYSQYGGLLFMNTPVKPDWDSPASMLGYYNALERKFEARPILRAMYQMQNSKDNCFNRLAMFLLDEMNLAHIELYFSDMLSKLEENRNKKPTESAQLDIDLGAGIDTLPVKLTRNMVWVGTMNEDETTKGLSDKVVDRSNIITFPRPKQLVSRAFNMVAEGNTLLKRETWDEWQTVQIELYNHERFHEITQGYKETIQEISEKLEIGGRALGHRVWQSIEHYIAAHPLVINNAKGIAQNEESQVGDKYLDAAFAEAVAFKVMPKLRGVETEGKSRKDCLTPIGNIISQKVSCLKVDYDKALKSPYGIFVWKSGEFLTQEID
jgi:hypothetical protein